MINVAITLWAIAITAMCWQSLKEVVMDRGFEPHDVLLLILMLGAPVFAIYCWLA